MRDKLRALYYPDFWVNYPTLIKCILLFDEIHFMDRPSLTFDGKHRTIGMQSPIRQYEQSFRDEGVPVYVHEPPSGPLVGELREISEGDISDRNFVARFQEGLRTSQHFRDLHIQPGVYGPGETHETIFQRLAAINLPNSAVLLDIHNRTDIRPYDFTDSTGALKTLVSAAAFCSVKMNFALTVGVTEGFSPLADMAPYASLLSAKYGRAIVSTPAVGGRKITATDLSLAILDELVPADVLANIKLPEAIKYRKESESARDAFLENLLAIQAKLGLIPEDGDYAATISRILTTEVRPAARDFYNKLETIYEKFLGRIAGATALAVGSPGVIQIFGDVTLQKLLLCSIAPAASFVIKEGIGALVDMRAASRDCAFSYLLELEEKK
jgi:hypothetical protein